MNGIIDFYLSYILENESILLEKKSKKPIIPFQVQYILNRGLATSAVFLPGGIIYLVTRKLYDLYDYKCAVKCYIIKDTSNKSICFKRCNLKSIADVISKVENELKDCEFTGNPTRCQKRLNKVLVYWKDLEIDAQEGLALKIQRLKSKLKMKHKVKLREQEGQVAKKLLRYIMLISDDIIMLIHKKKDIIKRKYKNRDEIIKRIDEQIKDKRQKLLRAKIKLQRLRAGNQ